MALAMVVVALVSPGSCVGKSAISNMRVLRPRYHRICSQFADCRMVVEDIGRSKPFRQDFLTRVLVMGPDNTRALENAPFRITRYKQVPRK